jgi:hypothetical protein
MRLGEDLLSDEPRGEPREIAPPVVGVVVAPIPFRLLWSIEGGVDLDLRPPVRSIEDRDRGADEDGAEDPLGMLGGQPQRVSGAHGEARDDRPIGPGRVEDRERVSDVFGVGVGGGVGRPVGVAVAAAVERDDPKEPGEVRDLQLPVPGVEE